MQFCKLSKMIIALLVLIKATSASAFFSELLNSVRQYQPGIDYSTSIDRVNLTYDMAATSSIPSTCHSVSGDSSSMRCSVAMTTGSNKASGFGFFLQKAFKRQGFYYFDYDLGFGARFLSGSLPAAEQSLNGLPLKNASFTLGAGVIKPYIELGITPDQFPDILLSLGPALQIAMGRVTINDKAEAVAVGTSSVSGPMSLIGGYISLEIVLKRFGKGAFSLIATEDFTGSGEGTKIYPKSIDGMSNFRGTFAHGVSGLVYGFGLKLVSPWP